MVQRIENNPTQSSPAEQITPYRQFTKAVTEIFVNQNEEPLCGETIYSLLQVVMYLGYQEFVHPKTQIDQLRHAFPKDAIIFYESLVADAIGVFIFDTDKIFAQLSADNPSGAELKNGDGKYGKYLYLVVNNAPAGGLLRTLLLPIDDEEKNAILDFFTIANSQLKIDVGSIEIGVDGKIIKTSENEKKREKFTQLHEIFKGMRKRLQQMDLPMNVLENQVKKSVRRPNGVDSVLWLILPAGDKEFKKWLQTFNN